MWVASYLMLSQLVKDLVGQGGSGPNVGILETCYMGLFQTTSPTPTPSLVLANIIEAAYSGYGRQLMVWRPTYVDQAGPQNLQSIGLFWQPTDGLNPETIGGAFIATTLTGGALLWSAAFTQPVSMASQNQAFTCVTLLQWPYTANYGVVSVIA